ncbi:MAG TPA: ATP-binding protein [bacterium]|nr:ATP-binding protein [bacterium]
MLLPKQKTEPLTELSDFNIFCYGHPKGGKSTWASGFPNAIFLATEAGLNALSTYQVNIDCWEKLLEACNELASGNHDFKNIIVDTVDNAWFYCRRYICEKHKVDFEGDLSYGKGHSLVLNEFTRVINKMSMLDFGLILISHATVQEIQTRTGPKHKTVPSLPEKPRKLILGLADMILYCDLETVSGPDGKQSIRRVMRTQPHPGYEAGDRTGRLPEVIDLNYDAFVRAFNGKPASEPKSQSTTKKTQ